MKNKTKLILANVIAFLAVVTVLSVSNLLGVQVEASGSIIPKVLLFVLPQIGFIYFYLKSSEEESKKAMA
ncbi:hypothetical protein [Cecembia lonarensis]|uniref:Uncharacterized protein n=1 Tax=Cecembia lonarensis (strain CCUG 58316 / KCTC 22772 / LW9) TaxID=1225176 RepID=K1KTD3_CECL9|nr:hypothetical protein [Cecembia lonarensis]EKB47440.1 hypothetical protein B879_03960 [Cecembia lonarensis LW9]